MIVDEEPVVTLPDGRRVLQAVYESVTRLQATGHHVTVCRGTVLVSPRVHDDCWYVLDSNSGDVEAVLSADCGSFH